MAILKRIIKRILREAGKENNISMFSDKKLISTIGMEMHCFYYPKKGQAKNPDYLKNLIKEAERRNLSHSENIKGAKAFLEEFKIRQNDTIDEDAVADFVPDKHFFELAKRRQSIRKFSERKISKEIIYQILKCAIEAPSSCNRQTWRFLILNDEKSLSFISKFRGIPFLENAATVICVLADKDLYTSDKELDYTIYMDGAAAIMNIIYAAESLSVSSCWVNLGGIKISKDKMKEFYKFFRLKPNFKPISLVALGYGVQNVKKPRRESLDYYFINEEK